MIIPINIQVHSHISYISYIDKESAYWPRSAKSLCWYGLFEILASARSEQTSSSPLARELTNLLWVHQQFMSSQPFNFRFGAKGFKHVQTLHTQMWAPCFLESGWHMFGHVHIVKFFDLCMGVWSLGSCCLWHCCRILLLLLLALFSLRCCNHTSASHSPKPLYSTFSLKRISRCETKSSRMSVCQFYPLVN